MSVSSTKPVLLLVAQDDFQTYEYHNPKRVLEDAGYRVVTASNIVGTARSTADEHVPVDRAIADIRVEEYSGIFLIGGPGAMAHLNNDIVHQLMRDTALANIPYGAICVSPRILANAGLLVGKHVTGWNKREDLPEFFADARAIFVDEPVVVDGLLVTANGPRAAEDFGKSIVSLLKASQ